MSCYPVATRDLTSNPLRKKQVCVQGLNAKELSRGEIQRRTARLRMKILRYNTVCLRGHLSKLHNVQGSGAIHYLNVTRSGDRGLKIRTCIVQIWYHFLRICNGRKTCLSRSIAAL